MLDGAGCGVVEAAGCVFDVFMGNCCVGGKAGVWGGIWVAGMLGGGLNGLG